MHPDLMVALAAARMFDDQRAADERRLATRQRRQGRQGRQGSGASQP